MKQLMHLQLAAKLEELHHIEAALASAGKAANWDDGLLYQVQLVLEELAVNTANYGFDEGRDAATGMIEVGISKDGDTIRIEYSDNGRAFNPFDQAPEPDLEGDLTKRRVGGLGVHFVRTMMDEVSYKREADRNHICLVKRSAT